MKRAVARGIDDEVEKESDLPIYVAVFLIFLIIVVALCDVDPVQYLQAKFSTSEFYRLSRDVPPTPAKAATTTAQQASNDVKTALEKQLRNAGKGAEALREKLRRDKLAMEAARAEETATGERKEKQDEGFEIRGKAATLQTQAAKEISNKETLAQQLKLEEQLAL